MINAPCKGCTERTVEPNCHAICERYKKFAEEHKFIREQRQKKNQENQYDIQKHLRLRKNAQKHS